MSATHENCPECGHPRATEVCCNKCGGSCGSQRKYGSRPVFLGLIDAEVFGHYDSPKLTDAHQYRFSLCEGCLMEMFDSFKVPVEKTEVGPWYE